jgi:hypothetical protein
MDDPTVEPLDCYDVSRGYRKRALPGSDDVILYDQHGRIDWDALARSRVAGRARHVQALLDQFPQEDE